MLMLELEIFLAAKRAANPGRSGLASPGPILLSPNVFFRTVLAEFDRFISLLVGFDPDGKVNR